MNYELEYFEWLYATVIRRPRPGYRALLTHLHQTDFSYYIPMDGNRASDGVGLRYRFGEESGIPHYIIANTIDVRPCSVLEVIVALALTVEESFMLQPGIDRTERWFMDMLRSLGLIGMIDAHFDPNDTDDILLRWMSHMYNRDGKGGLFYIPGRNDMRDNDLWYQMHRYIEYILEGQ